MCTFRADITIFRPLSSHSSVLHASVRRTEQCWFIPESNVRNALFNRAFYPYARFFSSSRICGLYGLHMRAVEPSYVNRRARMRGTKKRTWLSDVLHVSSAYSACRFIEKSTCGWHADPMDRIDKARRNAEWIYKKRNGYPCWLPFLFYRKPHRWCDETPYDMIWVLVLFVIHRLKSYPEGRGPPSRSEACLGISLKLMSFPIQSMRLFFL